MSRLRRLLLNNWYFKLLSLGLAYVLWLGVAHAPMAEVRVAVPLELRNLPTRLEVVSDVPVHVQVTLQGSEKLLRDLHYEELVAAIDLSGFGSGNHSYRLTADDVSVPEGISVVDIRPADLHLDLQPGAEP
jgi:YbbR domain-containing protein